MVDVKSGYYSRQLDARVRDSQDTSTAPGESAINPQGLWRRGQDSWHLGAGQRYADTADATDYRFYTSKGINPWTKGQLSLLNATKLSLSSVNSNLFTCSVKSSGGTEYLYVADGNTLKYTTDPFAATPTWTSVTTGAPAGVAITGLETNGQNVFIAYTSNDIYYTTPGSASVSFFYPTSGTTGKTYTSFGYAKGWGFAAVDNALYVISTASGSHSPHYTSPDTTLRWVGAAAGQNAVYAASRAGTHSIIYKLTLSSSGVFDVPVAALELPAGEIVTSIYGYLGYILIGTNKGVRFCTSDSNSNLISGALIPTTGDVYDFTAEGKYVWYTYTNYDGTSGGLGRLDLSVFTTVNTPAYATDLMYNSTAAVYSATTFANKRVFTIQGVGVIVEDTANLVSSGTIEVGTYRWGIPDRKFAPRVDIRVEPLVGSVSAAASRENEAYQSLGTHSDQGDTEHTFQAPESKFIEAQYRFTLTRDSGINGPVMTRWMSRAYASPARSRIITVPLILQERHSIHGRDYYFDVATERDTIEELALDPQIVTYQEYGDEFSVIVEDAKWIPSFVSGNDWLWEGVMVVSMRTITE